MVCAVHTVAPSTTKVATIDQQVNNNPKYCTLYFGGGHSSCYNGNQSLYFHQISKDEVFRAQDGVSRSLGSPTTTLTKIGEKHQ